MIARQFAAMFKARSMEFVRDRGTFLWNLFFPVFIVFGLAFAFSGGEDKVFKVGVVGTIDPSVRLVSMEQAQAIPYANAEDALRKLERHQLDFVLDFGAREFATNEESSKSRLARELFTAQQVAAATASAAADASADTAPAGGGAFTERTVTGRPTMMFSSLFGVGYVIVRYRKNGVLKRLKATPVHALNFVSAQAASRLVIVLLTSVFVYAGTDLILRFVMRGSYLNLLLLTAVGILCMISLGLVFASRMRSEELAGGMLNLVTFPMIALSGVFFSLEGSPPILRKIATVFPLTHFTDAARKIMLDGAGLAQIAPNLAVLAGLTVLFLVVSSILFKWE